MDGRRVSQATTGILIIVVGLLLLGHTGRIRMFRRTSRDLFDTYLDRLFERLPG